MDEIDRVIEKLKSNKPISREAARIRLHHITDKKAVSALIKALKDKDGEVLLYVNLALENIAEKCETLEELEKVERDIDNGLARLKKKHVDRRELIDVHIKIAKLTRKIAKKKDEITTKRDLLLDDKPKPPKKGRGVYRTARMIRNG